MAALGRDDERLLKCGPASCACGLHYVHIRERGRETVPELCGVAVTEEQLVFLRGISLQASRVVEIAEFILGREETGAFAEILR